MSNIAIFKLNQTPQYLTSVNTPDYSSDPDVIVDPDISALTGVLVKYWKRSGNTVVQMTQAEKNAVDAAELAARKAGADGFTVSMKDAFTALIKVINLRLPANQKITKQELIDAIKLEVL